MENMKTVELKEIARDLKVKDWWNLKKAELIAAIQEAQNKDYTIASENADGSLTVIAEVHHEDISEECQNESEDTEEAAEEAPKEVKKPSLKIKELTYDGRTQTIKEWAAELEMPWPTLYDRVNRNGWTVEEALTIPLGGRRKK